MLVYILAAAGLVLLLLLYRYLNNKKIFVCFCLTLLLAGGIAYKFWPAPEPAAAPISEQERYELMQQQQIFAAWYGDYQKDLEELDRNWNLRSGLHWNSPRTGPHRRPP